MRLQTLDVLLKAENVVGIEGTRRETAGAPGRILKGWMKNVSTLDRALYSLLHRLW